MELIIKDNIKHMIKDSFFNPSSLKQYLKHLDLLPLWSTKNIESSSQNKMLKITRQLLQLYSVHFKQTTRHSYLI